MNEVLNTFRDSFRNQIILCTVFMITAPVTTYLKLSSYLTDLWISKDTQYTEQALLNLEADVTTWAALGSILSI